MVVHILLAVADNRTRLEVVQEVAHIQDRHHNPVAAHIQDTDHNLVVEQPLNLAQGDTASLQGLHQLLPLVDHNWLYCNESWMGSSHCCNFCKPKNHLDVVDPPWEAPHLLPHVSSHSSLRCIETSVENSHFHNLCRPKSLAGAPFLYLYPYPYPGGYHGTRIENESAT